MSPSDFGFHNVIKKKKKLFFFDFEYAGMDDPVKLISDFICQPDHKLSKKQRYLFYNNILNLETFLKLYFLTHSKDDMHL